MELFDGFLRAHQCTGRSLIKYDGTQLIESLARRAAIYARRPFIALVAVSAAVILLPCASGASEEPMARPVRRGADAALGIYRQHCVNCHGKDGTGSRMREVMPQIPDFTTTSWQKGRTDVQLALSIREGKGKLMPAFDDRLSSKQAKDLVALVRSFNQSGTRKGRESATEFETQFAQLQKSLAELRAQFEELSRPPRDPGTARPADASEAVKKRARKELPPNRVLDAKKEPGEAAWHRSSANRLAIRPPEASLAVELMSVWPSPIHAYVLPTLWPLLLWAMWQTSRDPTLSAQVGEATLWPRANGGPAEEPGDAWQLFRRYCSKCHGEDGMGRRGSDRLADIPDFTDPRWQGRRNDPDLRASILDGQGTRMPPFREKINEDEADTLLSLVRAFGAGQEDDWGERAGWDESELLMPPQGFLDKLIAWLGNFHPPAVNFPIALLVAAALAELLRVVTGHPLYDGASRFCVWLGAATAIAAVALGWCRGGFRMSDPSWVVTAHRWLGTTAALWAQLVLALSEGSRRSDGRVIREAFRLTLFVGTGLVLFTGFLGGALVYGLDHYVWR
jgi:mono/diheme cytochrome c family protein/uncharacterized membrane protein